MSIFNQKHIKRTWKISGIEGVPPTLDPREVFPSVEIPSGKITQESGMFFSGNVCPTSFDLDPYFYFSSNTKVSNDYSIVARGKNNSMDIHVKKESISTSVKTMGLKGPMYLSGWGYDSAGLPVPNNYEAESSGEYKFNPKTSIDRSLWKTGPIDLRWHDKRKVWVGGHELLEGILIEDLKLPSGSDLFVDYTTAKMQVYRRIPRDYHTTKKEFITVTNVDPSLSAPSGTYIMVVDINYEWRPVWVGC